MEWESAPVKTLPIASDQSSAGTSAQMATSNTFWERFPLFGFGPQRIQGRARESGLEGLFERWTGVRDDSEQSAIAQMDIDQQDMRNVPGSSLRNDARSASLLSASRQAGLESRRNDRSLVRILSATYMLSGLARTLLLFAEPVVVEDLSAVGQGRPGSASFDKIKLTINALEAAAGLVQLMAKTARPLQQRNSSVVAQRAICWLHLSAFVIATLHHMLPALMIVPSILWDSLQRRHPLSALQDLHTHSSALSAILSLLWIATDVWAWSAEFTETRIKSDLL